MFQDSWLCASSRYSALEQDYHLLHKLEKTQDSQKTILNISLRRTLLSPFLCLFLSGGPKRKGCLRGHRMEEIGLPQIFYSVLDCSRVEGFARVFGGLNAIIDLGLHVCLP